MNSMMTRKSFIGAMAVSGFSVGCSSFRLSGGKRWYRGMLHMHSLWSDGYVTPEQAYAFYKEAGYDFVALTDHNRFQDDPDRWIPLGVGTEKTWPPETINPACYRNYMERFGETASVRKHNGRTQVRLSTFKEMKKLFEAAGDFLVLPGTEVTTFAGSGESQRAVHMNAIGIPAVIERSRKAWLIENLSNHDVASAMRETYQMTGMLAKEHGVDDFLFILDHPQWPYCDVNADDMIKVPEVCGFEICNGGASYESPAGYDHLKYLNNLWDAALVHRLNNGQGVLYGFGSDDTHYYPNCGTKVGLVNDGYIMVKAQDLTERSIMSAIKRGDFYASSQLDLDDVSFDPTSGTLSVSATPAGSEESLSIRFITTKKGVSAKPVSYKITGPQKEGDRTPKRRIPLYDEALGATVKVVKGAKGEYVNASYTLKGDDMYVRAIVESDAHSTFTDRNRFHPNVKTAWTQPYHL